MPLVTIHQPLLARAGGGGAPHGAPEPHHPVALPRRPAAGRPSLPLHALPAARKPPASTPPPTLTRQSSGCGGARPTAGSRLLRCRHSGKLARARPLLLWRVCRQEILVHARLRPEVPGAAAHHVQRVVRTRARVIKRNRGLYFAFRLFVPGVGACVGVSGGVGGLISRFFSTQRSFFPRSLSLLSAQTGWYRIIPVVFPTHKSFSCSLSLLSG